MASHVIVVTFPDAEQAAAVRERLRPLERAGQLALDDAATVRKDPDGKVYIGDEVDSGVKVGALAGGALGLLLRFMFPLAGLAIGAVGGALVGKTLERGVDQAFGRSRPRCD